MKPTKMFLGYIIFVSFFKKPHESARILATEPGCGESYFLCFTSQWERPLGSYGQTRIFIFIQCPEFDAQ